MHKSVFFLFSFFSCRPRWVVPVLPKGELEVLLEAAIDLSKKGNDVHLASVCFTDACFDDSVATYHWNSHPN